MPNAIDTSRPFVFRHDIDDPAFDIGAVVSLIEQHPEATADTFRGDGELLAPINGGWASAGETPDEKLEIARRIGRGEAANLVRVTTPEHTERYRAVLREAAAPYLESLDRLEGILSSGARIFFGGPGAVSQAHVDRSHGFLFQIHGTKRLTIAHITDEAERDIELDRACAINDVGASMPLTVVDELTIRPGDGVFIPACTYHGAVVGSETSLAMSTFVRTKATDRMNAVRACNHHLRRLRLSPRPEGGPFDGLKVLAVRARYRLGHLR